jgi:hypothetical protein
VHLPVTKGRLTLLSQHIIQPRLDNFSVSHIAYDGLARWYEYQALASMAEANSDNPRIVPGETQCQWCPAGINCKERYDMANQIASTVFAEFTKLPYVDDEVLYELLKSAPVLTGYIKALQKHAMSKILSGQEFPGFKMVRGKSNRKWKDEKSAQMWLMRNYPSEDELFESKFKSPAKIEKLIRGIKKNADFKDLFEKPPGALTFVPEEDPRTAETFDADDVFAEFLDLDED